MESGSSADIRPTLDQAIEECLRALENGNLNIDVLTRKFPEFESEICEFLENWGGMESVAAVLGGPDNPDHPTDDESDFDPGLFGDFELLCRIGAGGMGTIYKARQISLDRIVALKMFRRDRLDAGRFKVETETVAALEHPDIVSIYEVGTFQGRQFFTMQYIDGCDLKDFLRKNEVGPRQAAQLVVTIARAVHFAHQRGILHRDLKPANVLIDNDGKPFVTDFGLAKQIERDTELTQSGAIIGTPGYMAPEQASGKSKSLTVATDVYGLGALLYALLTGSAPFAGESSIQILKRVMEEPPISPRLRNKAVDRDLETVCLKCLEKLPELRYPSAAHVADDLKRFLNHVPVRARPISRSEKFWRWCQRNRLVAALSAAVMVLLIATTAIAVVFAWSENRSRLNSQASANRESALNRDLNKALERATLERINLLTANALNRVASQHIGEALLWFCEAGRIGGEDSVEANRKLALFESWLREHPRPVEAVLLDQRYCNVNSTCQVDFQPDGPSLLIRSGRQCCIWNPVRNSVWHLKEAFPKFTAAKWTPDGRSLIVGTGDGRVVLADVVTRQTQLIIGSESADEVLDLAFINRGRWLAVGAGEQVQLFSAIDDYRPIDNLKLPSGFRQFSVDSLGDQMAVVCYDSQCRVYSVDEDMLSEKFETRCSFRSIIEHPDGFIWPRFLLDGQALLVRVADGEGELIATSTGKQLAKFPLSIPAYSMEVSRDGVTAVLGSTNFARFYRFSGIRHNPANVESSTGNSTTLAPMGVKSDLQFTHANRVTTTDISSRGMVATAGWNSEVRLWRTSNLSGDNPRFDAPEKIVPEFVLPSQSRVRKVQFSEDGSRLVTVQIDGLVRVWQFPQTDSISYDIAVREGGSLAKAIDKNEWLASGMSQWSGHMTDAKVFQFADGVISGGTHDLSTKEHGHLLDSVVSPDGRTLATIHAGAFRSGGTYRQTDGKGGWLRFWNVRDGKLLHEKIPMPSEPRWVVWHPHQNLVAVCTCLMQIVLVDSRSFKINDVIELVENPNQAFDNNRIHALNPINEKIEFTPDGKSIVAMSTLKEGMTIWSIEKPFTKLYSDDNSGWPLSSFEFSPDGVYLALAGGRNPELRIVELRSGQFSTRVIRHTAAVLSARFSPDSKLIVTGSRDGHVRIFELASGKLLQSQMAHEGDVVDAAFTPDNKYIVSLGTDDKLNVWEADDGSLAIRPISVPPGSSQMLISADSNTVVVAGGQIRVINLSELRTQPSYDNARARQIAELLTSKTIVNGQMRGLSSTEWLARWRQ